MLEIASTNQDVPAGYSNLYDQATPDILTGTPIIIKFMSKGLQKETVEIRCCIKINFVKQPTK